MFNEISNKESKYCKNITINLQILKCSHGKTFEQSYPNTNVNMLLCYVSLPEMISGHVLNVLVNHMKSDRF